MKTSILRLWLALAAFATAATLPAQTVTTLNLVPTPAGGSLVIYWPAALTNGVIQYSTALTPANWITLSNAVPVQAILVSNTLPAGFFRYYQTSVTVSMNNGMAVISPVPFTMGDTLDGESDALPVSVTLSAFGMDTNLVTFAEWQAIYNWATNHGYSFDNPGAGQAAGHPVQTVNWYDTVKWCNARSQQAGLPPVYFTDAGLTRVYTNGDVNAISVNWNTNGYRLPTEAEWEMAARGGLVGQRFPGGNTLSETNANYYASPGMLAYDAGPAGYNPAGATGAVPYTTPAGSFPANGYGLTDMAGNVAEWCWDWYGTAYAGGSNPKGPATGQYRVLRGGSWDSLANVVRCASRSIDTPTDARYDAGFRCVRHQ